MGSRRDPRKTSRRRGAGAALGLVTAALVALTACGGGDRASSETASTSTGSVAGGSPSSGPGLRLVAIGDSIPFNSPDDCPGCTGFVDRYAQALSKATGKRVEVSNLSQHNGLTLPMLLDELDSFRDQLSGADAIIVGIAHNTIELNADKPCGTVFDESRNTFKDWSRLTPACAARTATAARAQYDKLFATVAGWRAGKPTILRTVNKYSDWVGWKAAHLTPGQETRTVVFHDVWNTMLCDSAKAHGFGCADVYHAFNGPDGRKASGNLLGADYTHPSDAGNAVIARTLVAMGFAQLA